MVQTEIARILPHYPDGRKALEEARATYLSTCPDDRAAAVVASVDESDTASGEGIYVGDYQLPFGAISIRVDTGGLLQLKSGNYPALTFKAISDGVFPGQDQFGVYYYLVFSPPSKAGVVHRVLWLGPQRSS